MTQWGPCWPSAAPAPLPGRDLLCPHSQVSHYGAYMCMLQAMITNVLSHGITGHSLLGNLVYSVLILERLCRCNSIPEEDPVPTFSGKNKMQETAWEQVILNMNNWPKTEIRCTGGGAGEGVYLPGNGAASQERASSAHAFSAPVFKSIGRRQCWKHS